MASNDKIPIRSTCHCGAITVIVPGVPDHINQCQCSICRRYSAAWGYYNPDEVKFETKPDAVTKKYIWGDKDISFNFCDTCGCVCYWYPIKRPEEDHKMGVNTRNMDPNLLRYVDVKIEYSWIKAPLNTKDASHPDDLANYLESALKT